MPTQAERRAAMRRRLVETARRLYGQQGHERTSTGQILRAAGVSRGALYHHFPSKRDLFEAVFEDACGTLVERLQARTPEAGDPVEALLAGCTAWLREMRDPAVARIAVAEAPKVLGWSRCRELDERHLLGLTRAALRRAVGAGALALPDVDLAARVLHAALGELALVVIRAPDPESALDGAEVTLRALLAGARRAD